MSAGGDRRHRRVQRPGATGADPTPRHGLGADSTVRTEGDTDAAWGDGRNDNDARLRRDLPPHWGKR